MPDWAILIVYVVGVFGTWVILIVVMHRSRSPKLRRWGDKLEDLLWKFWHAD